MRTRLIAVHSDNTNLVATAALGLASALAQDGWDTALVCADPGNGLLKQLLGPGTAGSSLFGLSKGLGALPQPVGPKGPKHHPKGLYWLAARGPKDPLDARWVASPDPQDLRHIQVGLQDLRVPQGPLHLVVLVLPPGASALGLALLAMADLAVYVLRSAEASLQTLAGVRAALAAQGSAPQAELKLALEPPGPDLLWLWVQILRDAPDMRLSTQAGGDASTWVELAAQVQERLALPHPNAHEQFRRSARVSDLPRCREAFARAWAQDREAAKRLFDQVCTATGGSLDAAVGAAQVLAADPHTPLEDLWHVITMAIQKLKLLEPTSLVKEIQACFDIYMQMQAAEPEPAVQARLLIGNASLKIHQANWANSQNQNPSLLLQEARLLLIQAASSATSAQQALRVAMALGMHARISADGSTWPHAETCLSWAEREIPESSVGWGAEIVMRYAIITADLALFERVQARATLLMSRDPARAHYILAIVNTQIGQRMEAWRHLWEVGRHNFGLYLYAPLDSDLRPLFADAGQASYLFTRVPNQN